MDRLQQEAQKAEEALALARLELREQTEEGGWGWGWRREGPRWVSGPPLPSAPHLHPHSGGGGARAKVPGQRAPRRADEGRG